MNCPYCSKEVLDTAKFCKFCGKKLPTRPADPADGAEPASGQAPEPPRRTEPPKTITAAPVENRCTKCGKPCPEGASLCAECLSRAMSRLARANTPPAPSTPPAAPPTPPQEAKQSKATRRPFPVTAVAAVLVLLLAACGGALAWRKLNATPVQADSSAAMEIQEAEPEAAPKAEAEETAPQSEKETTWTGESALSSLPRELNVGPWDDTRTLQGLEWDTDSLARCYVSNGRAVYAYDRDGTLVAKSDGVGEARLYSLDYHDGRVFSIMRSSDNGRFKLKVYDASSMKILVSTNLTDMHRAYRADQETYQSDLMPAIDAVVVAPRAGGGDEWKIYVSYNVYRDSKHPEALHPKQQIYEYDYESALSDPEEIFAERTLELDVGQVDFGLQTLEYEQDTNRMWCAVREGPGHKSLYCLDWGSLGLIKNGEKDGWDCPNAGNGFCSLGEDTYYVLDPTYKDTYSSATMEKVAGKDLEDVG